MPALCHNCGSALPDDAVECPRCGVAVDTQSLEPTTKKDPLVGSMLGEYEIKQRVGAGGMGIVYEALHPAIGKKVAIKVLRPDFAHDQEQVARLLSEARAVNAIRHRSIVDIFGLGTLEDARPYIVMEFLEGKSVDQILQREGKMSITDALGVLEEVVAALGAAHAAGVIHRDVKPSNIFVVEQKDGTRYVKLLDFGLAKRASVPGSTPHEKPTQLVGTPDYMAPEQAKGVTSPRSDLYSLGATAFEMLTGRTPFKTKTLIEMVVAHIQWPTPRPSAVEQLLPPAVDDFIMMLMEKDPVRRPASADAVRGQIMRLRKQLVLSATRIVAAPAALLDAGRPLPQALVTTTVKPAVRRGSKLDVPAQAGGAGKLNPALPQRSFTPGKPIPATVIEEKPEATLPRAIAALPDTDPTSRRALGFNDDFASAGAGDATVLASELPGDETNAAKPSRSAPSMHQTLDEEKPLGALYARTQQMEQMQPKKTRAVWPWIALAAGALLGLAVYLVRDRF